MKKYLFLAALLTAGFALTSCNDDEDEIITTTSTTNSASGTTSGSTPQLTTAVLDFESDSWNALIDKEQNNGPLLYGPTAKDYAWSDDVTSLSSSMTNAWGGFYGFSEGGVAISNYIDDDLENHATPDYQLSVPVSNNSTKFAVVYCNASIKFPAGKTGLIRTIDISPTTYELGVIKNGNGYAIPLTDDGSYLTLVVTADNGKTLNIDLARDGKFLETWKTFDFSSLGQVNTLSFSMVGSDSGSFGVNSPAYFAFDNVIVDIYK